MTVPVCLLVAAPTPAAAAPEDVRFSIQPSNGQARYIKIIHFNRCRAQRGVDAWSSTQCGPWEPIVNNQTVNLRGIYCVYAQWAPNRLHRGSFKMNPGGSAINYQIVAQPQESCP